MATSMVLSLTVVSYGLGCFTVAPSMGAVHDREVTGGGKASVRNDKFRAVNALIANIKTALTGTYHAIKFAKQGYRYLAEVQFRFNRRYDRIISTMTPRRANNIGRNVGVDRILPGCFDLPRRAIYDGCLGASFAQLGYGVPQLRLSLELGDPRQCVQERSCRDHMSIAGQRRDLTQKVVVLGHDEHWSARWTSDEIADVLNDRHFTRILGCRQIDPDLPLKLGILCKPLFDHEEFLVVLAQSSFLDLDATYISDHELVDGHCVCKFVSTSGGLKLNIVGQDNTDVFFEDEQRV